VTAARSDLDPTAAATIGYTQMAVARPGERPSPTVARGRCEGARSGAYKRRSGEAGEE